MAAKSTAPPSVDFKKKDVALAFRNLRWTFWNFCSKKSQLYVDHVERETANVPNCPKTKCRRQRNETGCAIAKEGNLWKCTNKSESFGIYCDPAQGDVRVLCFTSKDEREKLRKVK